MTKFIKCKTLDGQDIEFQETCFSSGGMKDVHWSPDKSYVVAFYREKQDSQAKERLQMITGKFRENLYNQTGGEYWKNIFCWPTAVVEHGGKLGIVAPVYLQQFLFKYGSINNDFLGIKGKEKQGKWFSSAEHRARYVDPRELGNWLNHLKMCLLTARAVKRLHAAGLAHSDLSYKNVLVDPVKGNACVIDVDGLVVPGKYPPDVVGTPDFIAPEVMMTQYLDKMDPNRKLPNIRTDQHALAVLIYMYLLYRHPLDGKKIHDPNAEADVDHALAMGEKANSIRVSDAKPSQLPWYDTAKIPYKVTGPYLSNLFLQAFVAGLHEPTLRPTADDWETALVKTVDLIQPCQNPNCAQKWYVFDNSTSPRCPFCGTPYKGILPVLNLYSSRREGKFLPDNHRLMVYTEQSLFMWHINRLISPNERLREEQKKRVGYFILHAGSWWLVNERLTDLIDVTTKTQVPIGGKVELKEGLQLLLSKEEGGRLVSVQMVNSQ
jgi:serine/threonine protein kinase